MFGFIVLMLAELFDKVLCNFTLIEVVHIILHFRKTRPVYVTLTLEVSLNISLLSIFI